VAIERIRTVLMAGGKGSRLRPFTSVFPKPLMPIGDVPIMDIVIRQLRHFGCKDITIATGYLAELVFAYLGDGSQYGLNLKFVREKEPLGTIGALSLVPIEDSESYLVLNGDVLTTMDFGDLVRQHRESGAVATVATYRRPSSIDKGVLTIEPSGRILAIVEKPTHFNSVAMGIYVFERDVVKFIRPGMRLDAPQLIESLIRDGSLVQSYMFDGYWLDIGLPRDYEQALSEFETNRKALLHEGP
jgi:NDP-sugar pyrophosphorylase family protein